jgi:Fe-Mn family superoxide dismutase
MPTDLRNYLETDFGSLSNLRDSFLSHARAMFGGGFVWLVYTGVPFYERSVDYRSRERCEFKIMHTYNAGSPLPNAHWRAQLQDTQHIRIDGRESHQIAERIAKDATQLVQPVLCVSVWEHSYLVDWRVQGREQYLEAWWERIDWDRVANIAGVSERV